MATIDPTLPSWIDVAKRLDPNGAIDAIVELLAKYNPFVFDGVVMEGNLTTGHRTTNRTGLPTAYWRMLNQGVPRSKSTTAQVTDTCGSMSAYSEIDAKLARLNGNDAAFMASEDSAFLEAMSQQMETATIYGNTVTNPEQFMGLHQRYINLLPSGTTFDPTRIEHNVIDAGDGNAANAEQTSIWLCTWGPGSLFYMYPKGSQAGWQRDFKGQETLLDSAGNQFEGYRTYFEWDLGLCVKDWRATVRIANIDAAVLTASSGTTLEKVMIQAINRRRGPTGRSVFYCHESVHTALMVRAQAKSNVQLDIREWAGQPMPHFWGIPIRVSDSILTTESPIVAAAA